MGRGKWGKRVHVRRTGHEPLSWLSESLDEIGHTIAGDPPITAIDFSKGTKGMGNRTYRNIFLIGARIVGGKTHELGFRPGGSTTGLQPYASA